MAELALIPLLSSPPAILMMQQVLADTLGNVICISEVQGRGAQNRNSQDQKKDPKTPKANDPAQFLKANEEHDSNTIQASARSRYLLEFR